MMLPVIIRETGANPDFSVIWLHGLGADGSDFVPVIPELGLPGTTSCRWTARSARSTRPASSPAARRYGR